MKHKKKSRMIRLLIVFVTAILIVSCGQKKPKIDIEKIDTASVIDNRIKDTTKVLIAELPIKFDSTDILLFTVGLVSLNERNGYNLSIRKSSYGESDFDQSGKYFHNDNLSGNFINIIFQDSNGQVAKLTDKKIQIESADFLREVYRKTKTGYILYKVHDRDSDGDNELTYSDLEALYISQIDGLGFTKLTKELHEFYDCDYIKGECRIYYRTLEDRNKDGQFDKKDKFHYYYIDFLNDKYLVTEYNPLKIFE